MMAASGHCFLTTSNKFGHFQSSRGKRLNQESVWLSQEMLVCRSSATRVRKTRIAYDRLDIFYVSMDVLEIRDSWHNPDARILGHKSVG